MVSKWKIRAVYLAAAAAIFMGGCAGKSTATGTKAAETTAAAAMAAAPAAAPEESGAEEKTAIDPAELEGNDEDLKGPEAEAVKERAAEGPGSDLEDEDESGDKDIEAFAELVQEAVADKDMESLAALASFPLKLETADGESFVFESREDFLKENPDLIFGDDLMVTIAGVDTATLELKGDGVTMGEETPYIRYEKMEDESFAITEIRE